MNVPFIALTATATPATRIKIIRMLALDSPIVTLTTVDRQNIFLSASKKTKDIVDELKQFMVTKDGKLQFNGDTIIYCISIAETSQVKDALESLSIDCDVYHASLE